MDDPGEQTRSALCIMKYSHVVIKMCPGKITLTLYLLHM